MNIALIGPTCSGKSTMASALALVGRLSRIETGAFVRRAFPQDKLIGGLADCEKQIREFVDQELSRPVPGGRGHVLDGFPRTTEQLCWLLESGHKVHFMLLDVDREEALRRAILRVRSDVHRFEEHYLGQRKQTDGIHEYMHKYAVPHYHAVGAISPEGLARWLLGRIESPHECGKEEGA